jgi:hypothetical protein
MHPNLSLNSHPSIDDEVECMILSIRSAYLFTIDIVQHTSLFRDLISDIKLKYNLQECQLSNEAILSDETTSDMIPDICYFKLVIQGDELFPYYRQILSSEGKEQLDGRLHPTLSDDQVLSISKVVQILDYVPYLIDDLRDDLFIAMNAIDSETFFWNYHLEPYYRSLSNTDYYVMRTALIRSIRYLLKLESSTYKYKYCPCSI